jgi:hypothetical protein
MSVRENVVIWASQERLDRIMAALDATTFEFGRLPFKMVRGTHGNEAIAIAYGKYDNYVSVLSTNYGYVPAQVFFLAVKIGFERLVYTIEQDLIFEGGRPKIALLCLDHKLRQHSRVGERYTEWSDNVQRWARQHGLTVHYCPICKGKTRGPADICKACQREIDAASTQDGWPGDDDWSMPF